MPKCFVKFILQLFETEMYLIPNLGVHVEVFIGCFEYIVILIPLLIIKVIVQL